MSDLKVEQLAIILGQCHQTLTSQTLFSLGGELLEVHRKALASMKRQEDGTERSLTLRIEVSKRMSWSEKRWRDRLISILSAGTKGASFFQRLSHQSASLPMTKCVFLPYPICT